jgi:hypothetical protein
MTHPSYATRFADVGGHSLERHDGDSSCIFCHGGLLGINDIHDDAALLHSCKATLEEVASLSEL